MYYSMLYNNILCVTVCLCPCLCAYLRAGVYNRLGRICLHACRCGLCMFTLWYATLHCIVCASLACFILYHINTILILLSLGAIIVVPIFIEGGPKGILTLVVGSIYVL